MSKRKPRKKKIVSRKSFNWKQTGIIAFSNGNDPGRISDFYSQAEGLFDIENLTILIVGENRNANDFESGHPIVLESNFTQGVSRLVSDSNFGKFLLLDIDRATSLNSLNTGIQNIGGCLSRHALCLPVFTGEKSSGQSFAVFAEKEPLQYLLDHISGAESSMDEANSLVRGLNSKALIYLDHKTGEKTKGGANPVQRFKSFLNWHVTVPLRERKMSPEKKYSFLGESSIYRFAFFITAVASLFLMTVLSQNAAVSGDEYRYLDQASRVYDYYTSLGADKSAVTQRGIDPQHYNAQSFDNVLYAVQKWLGMPPDSFGFRHFWNAVVGWLAMLFAALIALRIGGYRMAWIAFLLLLLSPRFLGHSYNNHRDIPMAASVCFAVYFMIPYLRSLPKINWKYFLWVVVGIAWAYSLRLGGGVLVMGYLLAFTGIAYLVQLKNLGKMFTELPRAATMLGTSLLACAGGFALGVLTWPFALESPIANSLEVLSASAELGVSLRQVFEGEQIWSNAMPWYYTGKYMLITIPAFILAAFGLSFFVLRKVVNKGNLLPYLMVLASVVLPLYYALFQVNTHYGGWRHFLFVYPFIAIIASLGIEGVFRHFKGKKAINFLWPAMIVLMLHPISFIVKNHPMEYTYFNEIIGGTKNAHGYYETDYSLNSLKEASEWLIENVLEGHQGDTLIIATNDRRASKYYLRNHTKQARVKYTRYYDKSSVDWDYATFYCALMSPHQIREGYWPPVETVHEVLVDGVPLGAVVRRVSKDDYRGFQALEQGNIESAVNYFTSYLEKNPYSEEVWGALAQIQIQAGQAEEALFAAEKSLELMPTFTQGLQIRTSILLNIGQTEEALHSADALISSAEQHFIGYFYKALALQQLNRHSEAIEEAEYAMRLNPGFRGSYQVMAESFEALGDREMANRVMQLMQQNTN